ncbi:uncharacterized protein TEOVI_000673400 [Trypanosoma equiperdum]|uniref:Uncharacterized protein n=2 Tax=Trypanozoon TaxID=39700 RepID=Q57YJ5_TRYB2|nr:hypothetical protein, conserved [Trypanosoma brucei brucei TREU927]AAX69306.1 hypothetical protein, conserved [Trypanosoma brucei]AAZ13358.1 hypothetical protein, conserved [Trypanosoma brucei brucei TREU927]SCU64567.1 hypothetical protein, conserved [Trypanosoma equiperdum]
MDKARPFEYVYRLTANTIEELSYGEAVYDRQVLLNESWRSYATRKGRLDELERERVKWITRTWEEEEEVRVRQREVLDRAEAEGEKEIARREEKLRQRKQQSNKMVEHLMAHEERLHSSRIPCRHNLFVDFDDFQQLKFNLERNVVSTAENFLRVISCIGEEGLFEGLLIMGEYDNLYHSMRLADRLRREEEERRRLEEERLRAIEEQKRLEEMRQRELEEAERLRKEAMDQAKLIERKRREEERRARARATREKSKQRASHENQAQEVSLEQTATITDAPRLAENSLIDEVKPVGECSDSRIPEGENITDMISSGCSMLTAAGDVCCVLSVDKELMKSTCVCQNGIWGEAALEGSVSNMLGWEVGDETSLIFASEKLYRPFPDSLDDYCLLCVEELRGSDFGNFCTSLDSSSSLNESLIMLPLQTPDSEVPRYVFVICRQSGDLFDRKELETAAKIVWELGKAIPSPHGGS